MTMKQELARATEEMERLELKLARRTDERNRAARIVLGDLRATAKSMRTSAEKAQEKYKELSQKPAEELRQIICLLDDFIQTANDQEADLL